MGNAFMRGLGIFPVLIVVILNFFLVGCGGAEDDVDTLYEKEDDVDTLYEELVGTYEFFRAELTFADGRQIVLGSPDIAGSMTISSDRKMTQTIKVYGNFLTLEGTFEIFPDEGVIETANELVDLVSRATYTWDGSILKLTLKLANVIETDFWRKL